MTLSAGTAQRAVVSARLTPRWSRVLRAAVLVTLGLVILFTATRHGDAAFDTAVVSLGLAAIGVVHLIEWVQRLGRGGGASIALMLGLASLASAVLVFVLRTPFAFAVLLAAWALVCALLEFVGMVVAPGTRQDAALVGAAGVLLSLAVLLCRDDVVAVVGFFGGYTILAGVFLGIAAFDTRRDRGATPEVTHDSPAHVESEA